MPVVSPKREFVDGLRQHQADTGSAPVQIALLSARIDELTDHLKVRTGDKHSRYGLMILVSRRRKLLDYVKRENISLYKKLLERLELRS